MLSKVKELERLYDNLKGVVSNWGTQESGVLKADKAYNLVADIGRLCTALSTIKHYQHKPKASLVNT
jgi:hypothetical protein